MSGGPVDAGVVGTRKFFYDVRGDAVNMAARMESTGSAGKIQVSQETCQRLQDRFVLEECGETEVKGKGQMRTSYLIECAAHPAAAPAHSPAGGKRFGSGLIFGSGSVPCPARPTR
jgi:adenylate cyclase